MSIPAKKGIERPYVYKTPDLCRFLGVSRITVWMWEKKGWLTAPRNSHGDRMFTVEQMRIIKRRIKPHKKLNRKSWHFVEQTA